MFNFQNGINHAIRIIPISKYIFDLSGIKIKDLVHQLGSSHLEFPIVVLYIL